MPSIRLCVALTLVCGLLGCGEALETLLSGTGSSVIREIPADEARQVIASGGARLVQPWPLAVGDVRVPGAEPVPFDEDAIGEGRGDEGDLIIVVGREWNAWALASRIRRSGHHRVAISPGDAEAWPMPRAAFRENPPDASLTDGRGW